MSQTATLATRMIRQPRREPARPTQIRRVAPPPAREAVPPVLGAWTVLAWMSGVLFMTLGLVGALVIDVAEARPALLFVLIIGVFLMTVGAMLRRGMKLGYHAAWLVGLGLMKIPYPAPQFLGVFTLAMLLIPSSRRFCRE